MRGSMPSCTACWVSENTPEITACEAITVASGKGDQRIERPGRRQLVERLRDA